MHGLKSAILTIFQNIGPDISLFCLYGLGGQISILIHCVYEDENTEINNKAFETGCKDLSALANFEEKYHIQVINSSKCFIIHEVKSFGIVFCDMFWLYRVCNNALTYFKQLW